MSLSLKKIAAVLILSGVLLAVLAGAAIAAPPWSDAPAAWWTSSYGITEAEAATVADGYPDGTFRPGQAVTRGQFAKMAVAGLGVATANPATPTFKDVAKGGTFYIYVEGAYAAKLIGGYTTGANLYYKPDNTITRQQANSILGRYLSQLKIDMTGAIHGDVTNYGTLDLWYNAEGSFYLNAFDDASKVASTHRASTAYLIRRGIISGSSGRVNPLSTLVRAQAAAMVVRVRAEAVEIVTPPTAPTNLGVAATDGGGTVVKTGTGNYVGNDSTPRVTGDTLPSRPIAVYDTVGGITTKLIEDSSNAAGNFYADLTVALADGTHSFTARVKNTNGVVSGASEPVTYILDTVIPSGTITAPAVAAGLDYAITLAKPTVTVTATDATSGVVSVEFQVTPKDGPAAWTTISTDLTADAGTSSYTSEWPLAGTLAAGLADGRYLVRAIITDLAGNVSTLAAREIAVDTQVPTVTITAPLPAVAGNIFYTEDPIPVFTADAADAGSGVAKVEFFHAPWSTTKPTTWAGFLPLSTDETAGYSAVYSALPEGHYIFAVRATDKAGNQSVLMDGVVYKAGVTQEVLIDYSAPTVTITAPAGGESLEEGTTFTIRWTATDSVTPPEIVWIDYTLDGTRLSPDWVGIDTTADNTGSYVWTVPEVGADNPNLRIRIKATDMAGALVGDIPGHSTEVWSAFFTVYDPPEAATGLTASDLDALDPGVSGLDFSAVWVNSLTPDIVAQNVYILPAGTVLDLSVHSPVSTFNDNTTNLWNGSDALVVDSAGAVLSARPYQVWVVVTDSDGHKASATSAAFMVVAD